MVFATADVFFTMQRSMEGCCNVLTKAFSEVFYFF